MGWEQFDQIWDAEFTHFFLFVSFSEIDCLVLNFILSDYTNVVVGINLGISNLFVEVVTTFVNANCVSLEEEGIVDLLCELIAARVHWDQLKLSWGEPEIPFSTCVFA